MRTSLPTHFVSCHSPWPTPKSRRRIVVPPARTAPWPSAAGLNVNSDVHVAADPADREPSAGLVPPARRARRTGWRRRWPWASGRSRRSRRPTSAWSRVSSWVSAEPVSIVTWKRLPARSVGIEDDVGVEAVEPALEFAARLRGDELRRLCAGSIDPCGRGARQRDTASVATSDAASAADREREPAADAFTTCAGFRRAASCAASRPSSTRGGRRPPRRAAVATVASA